MHPNKLDEKRIDALKFRKIILFYDLRGPDKAKMESDLTFGSRLHHIFNNLQGINGLIRLY